MRPGQRPAAAGWNKGKGRARQWLEDHIDYPHDYCLVWPFSNARGYGEFTHLGVGYYAHRFMCELVHGSPPTPEHQAAHSCGNGAKACVNPRHISWKTPSENQLDKREHGTACVKTYRYKLTRDQVLEIRSLKGYMTQDELAEKFGVGRQNIGAILTGRSWPDLQ